MSDLDASYMRRVELFSEQLLDASGSVAVVLEGLVAQQDAVVLELVGIRAAQMSDAERSEVGGLMATGVFAALAAHLRIGALRLAVDVEEALVGARLTRECERYHADQPLFRAAPGLLAMDRDREMINAIAARNVLSDSTVELERGFTRLSAHLPVGIVRRIREECRTAPTYVRLDPYRFSTERPASRLDEVAIRPANPTWWNRLALWPGRPEGAQYRLEPDAPLGTQAWTDFHVLRVRRIESYARREAAGRVTMMIEELQEVGHFLVGRCVHWDTMALKGVAVSDAVASHMDLAINVYSPAARDGRLQMTLASGDRYDATMRTHLLRVDHCPVRTVTWMTEMFLQSRTLIAEFADGTWSAGCRPVDG